MKTLNVDLTITPKILLTAQLVALKESGEETEFFTFHWWNPCYTQVRSASQQIQENEEFEKNEAAIHG